MKRMAVLVLVVLVTVLTGSVAMAEQKPGWVESTGKIRAMEQKPGWVENY